MQRNALTARYLDEVGLTGDELPAFVDRTVDLGPTSYQGRSSLSRPAFLSHDEVARLESDLDHLTAAIGLLPERLYGGDLGAFARAIGFASPQVDAIVRGSSPGPTRITRADLYHDGTDFKLMEFNQSGALGGLDVGIANQAQLKHPAFAAFAAAHRVTYLDPLAEIAESMFIECGLPRDKQPTIAVVDTPESFATLEPRLRASADQLAEFGLTMLPCHLGQLRFGAGQVWLDDAPVDAIYRLFLLEDLLDPELLALVDPVLRAHERGEVLMFTPLDTDLYDNKAVLALLSHESNRHIFTPGQLTSLDRLLPWTRSVRDETVTIPGGERVDLLSYAADHRADLVLKPVALHGGTDVVLGWRVGPDEWRRRLDVAADKPYVLQQRIHPAPEPFPVATGGTVPMILRWGVFRMSRGYAGAFVRGSTDLTGSAMTVDTDALTQGTVFHGLGRSRG